MVHHSIAVVFTSFLTNFLELRKAEVQLGMIYLARNGAKARPQSPAYLSTSSLASGAAPPDLLTCKASSSCGALNKWRERWDS
jgi:hypothetical protein